MTAVLEMISVLSDAELDAVTGGRGGYKKKKSYSKKTFTNVTVNQSINATVNTTVTNSANARVLEGGVTIANVVEF